MKENLNMGGKYSIGVFGKKLIGIDRIAEWIARFAPSLFGLPPDQVKRINDDRIGRNLDVLYDSDRGSMLTDLVVRIVRDFHINMDEFHNDSTTILQTIKHYGMGLTLSCSLVIIS